MKDLSKNISLHCVVCGNDQFSTVDDSIESSAKKRFNHFGEPYLNYTDKTYKLFPYIF